MALDLNQDNVLNKNRYRLYREHKYIFHVFSELLQLASILDLTVKESLIKLKSELRKLELLLQSHAEHEESKIHLMLKQKNSSLFDEAENQHRNHDRYFEKINEKINLLNRIKEKEVYFLSYEIYLDLRHFFSETLKHFDYEERIIMPELQRLYGDEEIREVDRISYKQMSPEEMIDMMEILFPHMNCEDRFAFLNDIKDYELEKFKLAWNGIYLKIEENERNNLIKLLGIC